MSQNSQETAAKAETKPTDWFFIRNEHDDTCAIGDPDERMPVARAVNEQVATRICKAVNDRDELVAALRAIEAALPELRRDGSERVVDPGSPRGLVRAALAKAGAA